MRTCIKIKNYENNCYNEKSLLKENNVLLKMMSYLQDDIPILFVSIPKLVKISTNWIFQNKRIFPCIYSFM